MCLHLGATIFAQTWKKKKQYHKVILSTNSCYSSLIAVPNELWHGLPCPTRYQHPPKTIKNICTVACVLKEHLFFMLSLRERKTHKQFAINSFRCHGADHSKYHNPLETLCPTIYRQSQLIGFAQALKCSCTISYTVKYSRSTKRNYQLFSLVCYLQALLKDGIEN